MIEPIPLILAARRRGGSSEPAWVSNVSLWTLSRAADIELLPTWALRDRSANGYDATLLGGPTVTAGPQGTTDAALVTNGSSQTAVFGDILDSVFAASGAQFSISLWFYLAFGGNNNYLLAKYSDPTNGNLGASWLLRLLSNRINFSFFSASGGYRVISGGTIISSGAWHHVAIVYDGTQAENARLAIYLDGAAETLSIIATNGSVASIRDSITPVALACMYGTTGANYFAGRLYGVRVYPDLLTPDKVSYLRTHYY